MKNNLKLLLISFIVIFSAINAWADNTTASVSISTYSSTNNWTSGTAYSTIAVDSNVSATGKTNGNNSKYYSSNNSWRHYEGDNGTVTIAVTGNYVLESITFTYANGNNGVLKFNNSNVTSGTECTSVAGSQSVVFSVGHSSGTKNGNVQITDISVTYTPTHTLTYSATNGSISGVVYNTSTAVASGAAVAEGGKVTLTATPNDGFTFTGWSVNGTGSSVSDASANPTTFTMGTANTTVTANFQAAGDYILADPTTVNIATAGDVAEFSLSSNISTPSYFIAYYTTSDGDVTTTKPTWFGDVEFSGNALNVEVTANSGSARSAYFKVYSGETYSSVITVNQAALTVQAPSFEPESGTVFVGSDIVELSCETAGSTIYYTMGNNPDDPTKSSTEYDPDEGIAVTTSTTIKAIAYVGDVASAVSTASYTVVQPLTTMDEIYTASSTAGTYYVTMNNWVVSGVSGSQAFVTDGTKGFIIYKSNHGFAVGDVLSGTVQAALTRYNGSAEFTNLTSTTTNLTVTTGGSISPQGVSISALGGVNTGALITVGNVTYNGTYLVDANNNTIKPYNTLYNSMSFSNNTEYNVTGVYLQYGETKEILPRSSADIVEVTDPALSIDPEMAQSFSYVYGSGPSDDQMFTVTGANLTSSDITATVTGQYEITDASVYGSSVTIASGDIISIRLKAGLDKGEYNGTLTLSSEGAENVVVNLSGSVTGQTYAISQKTDPAVAHGTITFSPESPIEDGTEVTLAAEPADGYDFTANSWAFYKQSGEEWVVDNSISVSDNIFSMPSYALKVDGSFVAKTTYAITTAITPDGSGTIETDENAWEGKTVSVEVEAAAGYTFSSIVVTKTGDSSTSIPTSGTANAGFTFTMPAYPVTVTVAFDAVYSGSGSFIKYTSAISEGYYVITYDDYALKNSVSSNRFENGSFTVSNNTITNPNVNIVWKIQANGNYWTLYNEAESKYAAGTGSKNQGALISSVTDYAKWTVTVSNGEFQFENLGRSTASSDSGNKWLRNNGTNGWACYASGTGGALTLYKLQDASEPAIILENTSIEVNPAFSEGTITVNCLNIDNPNLEVLFYQSNGSTSATYDWLTASINDDGNVAYTINANTGEARNAYFKVHETTNDVFSELVTISQALYVIDYASLPFEYDGNGTGTLPTGFTCDGLSTYASSPKMQFNTTGDWAILKVNETPGVLSFDIKGNSFSNGTFTVQTSDDGITYTDLVEYTELGTTQTKTFVNLSTTVRYIKWIYTEKVNGNVALGNIKLYNAIPATAATVLSENKYVTSFYSSTKNYQLSEGALAYTVGLVNDKLVFYRIGETSNVIPKGNAVVIISSDESIKYTEIKDNEVPAGTTIHAGNKLKGRDTDYTPEGTVYVLGIDNNNGIGFYKLKPGTTIPAGKAYYEAE